jgi:hypothetical protein
MVFGYIYLPRYPSEPTTMAYLIHTNQHIRPFLTTVAFLAQDFSLWGYRVDHHAASSAYIAEIRRRERENTRYRQRPTKLMEIWAHETMSRKRDTGRIHERRTNHRVGKASDVFHDFLDGVTTHGKCDVETGFMKIMTLISPKDTQICPEHHSRLVLKYMLHLHAVRYTKHAPLPRWSHPTITHADQIAIEFKPFSKLKLEHLVHAVGTAVGKDEGRMGRVERDTATGITKVVLFVDVGECLVRVGSEDEGDWDPVPVYEMRERPPEYTGLLYGHEETS